MTVKLTLTNLATRQLLKISKRSMEHQSLISLISLTLQTFPAIDLQTDNASTPPASLVSSNVPIDIIDTIAIEPNDTNDFPDFQMLVETFDADEPLQLDQIEQDGLNEDMNAYENDFFPINHPIHIAGVKVNRKGDIILQNDDEEQMKTLRIREMDRSYVKVAKRNNNLHLVSKENKTKVGRIFAFDIYRNGTWLKACDLHLATEIVKTFVPLFQKKEIEVIHYDGDYNNCNIDNLVAKVKCNDAVKASLMNVAPSNDWAQVKLWNGDFLPN